MSLFGDLSDIPELSVVEPGEYDLRVTSAKQKSNKDNTRDCILLVCEVVGEDNAEDVFHRLWMPNQTDDDSKARTMLRMIKEFLTAVGLPTDGSVELEDFDGLEFCAKLKIDEWNGQRRNEIERVV